MIKYSTPEMEVVVVDTVDVVLASGGDENDLPPDDF